MTDTPTTTPTPPEPPAVPEPTGTTLEVQSATMGHAAPKE